MKPERVHLRRRLAALAALGLLAGGGAAALIGAGTGGPSSSRAARAQATPTPTPPPELPGGGRTILPGKRVVAFYGNPAHDELGILGIGTPTRAGKRLLRQARPYARKTRPVLPVMELIATIANAHPGQDGLYRSRVRDAVIRRYLKAARKIGALLVLDIQPGKADFFTETVRLQKWLEEPDVGLALDPEWRITGSQAPGKVIGTVSAREVNAVTAWLDQLTERRNLPQKLLIIHQFTFGMIQNRDRLKPRDNLAIVINADGFGGRAVKSAKYESFQKGTPRFHEGFKLFYKEDAGLMTPRQVLRLRPPPDVVVYE